jgi:hypothetical protein
MASSLSLLLPSLMAIITTKKEEKDSHAISISYVFTYLYVAEIRMGAQETRIRGARPAWPCPKVWLIKHLNSVQSTQT